MISVLSSNAYHLWKIARDAGFTPRELSTSYEDGEYTISVEQIVSNAIALCHSREENPEIIISALQQLHDLGVVPYVDGSTVFFTEDHKVIFLTTIYCKAYSPLDIMKYADLVSSLTDTPYIKKGISREEINIYMQAASIGAAPEIIEVIGDDTLVTRRYPYCLVDAFLSGRKLTSEAKLSLKSKMNSLHSLGILHRDITGQNLVCNIDGTQALIIDFGNSVRVDTDLITSAKKLEIMELDNLLRHF